ncbi:MAG: hypothetical protein K2K60_07085 [Clostridia bacterium]|nr:hypothetical protein [Clostridia bacterium]
MKKFAVIILTLISFGSVALTMGGCNKMVRPEFTTGSPFFNVSDVMQNNQIYRSFNTDTLPLNNDPYKEFISYYKSEFKEVSNKQFYFLDLGEPSGEIAVDRKRSCALYGNLNSENKLENFFLAQYIQIYDKDLGGYYDKKLSDKDGQTNWSIILSFICAPVECEVYGEISLEFGTLNTGTNWFYNTFVNIYKDNLCLATCYYVEGVEIPLSWYENYFKNNLIYGGNL